MCICQWFRPDPNRAWWWCCNKRKQKQWGWLVCSKTQDMSGLTRIHMLSAWWIERTEWRYEICIIMDIWIQRADQVPHLQVFTTLPQGSQWSVLEPSIHAASCQLNIPAQTQRCLHLKKNSIVLKKLCYIICHCACWIFWVLNIFLLFRSRSKSLLKCQVLVIERTLVVLSSV